MRWILFGGSLTLALALAACEDKGGDSGGYADRDGDGWAANLDCDDQVAAINPSATEIPYNGIDEDCNEATPDDDLDGDGVLAADDCDDDDDDVYPGGVEICDGADNDCDGEIDDSESGDWYADEDGDGYGDAGRSGEHCEPGWVEFSGDCNDHDPNISPGADEICDDLNVDEDCDGYADDDDGNPSGEVEWLADADGDGYGDDSAGEVRCDPVGAFTVSDGGDCDDQNPNVNPGEQEVCDDRDLDEDCNGLADDDDSYADTDTMRQWYLDEDGDGYGIDDGGGHVGCDPSGDYSGMYLTDCDDRNANRHPGAEEVCDPLDTDEDCDGYADEDDPELLVPVWFTDLDGDGYGDADLGHAQLCEPSGNLTAEYGGDCDEFDAAVNPGAAEICNEVDDNCNGDVDDDDPLLDTSTTTTYYADADEDGYGDVDDPGDERCERASPGDVTDNTDCDDGDAGVNPGEDEICDSADTDEDCDGVADDDDSSVALSSLTSWYPDSDGDGYGDEFSSASPLCEAPSGYVANGSDCDDADSAISPAATEVCDAADTDEDCDGYADDDDSSADTSTMTTWYADLDGDTYGDPDNSDDLCDAGGIYTVTDFRDCDDSAASAYPGGNEVCDDLDVDEDCDGSADDDDSSVDSATFTTWYYDGDGDGYAASGASSTTQCDAEGYYQALETTDCDDTSIAFSPDAFEVCDDEDADEDCDGLADDDDSSTIDQTDWYVDGDGDGYGGGVPTTSCDQPSGTTDESGDCDDADAASSPGAYELCSDSTDNDCNGVTDDCLLDGANSVAGARASFYGVDSYDNAGFSVSNAGDVNDDGYDDVLIGAYRNGDGYSSGGAAYLMHGPVSGTWDLAEADIEILGTTAAYLGYSVAIVDLNDDGYDDVVAGGYYYSSYRGGVFVYYGPLSADQNTSTYDALRYGSSSYDYAGFSISPAGDMDGDGVQDVIIGAYGDDSAASSAGAAYVVHGPITGNTTMGARRLLGESSSDSAGGDVAGAGDVDGDGIDDALVGAGGEDSGGSSAGAVYLVLGPLTGSQSLSDAQAKLIGENSSDYVGYGMAAGDTDGDGYRDLLVGAYANDSGGSASGAAYLVLGVPTGDVDLSAADMKITGASSSDYLGRGVEVADLDDDGYDDVIAGAYYAGSSTGGETALFFGPVTGALPFNAADARIQGASYSYSGISLSADGDVNADGFIDLLVGGIGNSPTATSAGNTHLVLGGDR